MALPTVYVWLYQPSMFSFTNSLCLALPTLYFWLYQHFILGSTNIWLYQHSSLPTVYARLYQHSIRDAMYGQVLLYCPKYNGGFRVMNALLALVGASLAYHLAFGRDFFLPFAQKRQLIMLFLPHFRPFFVFSSKGRS